MLGLQVAPESSTGRLARRRAERAALAAAVLWAGLATPSLAQSDANDPIEPFNRMIFSFNELLDLMFLEPASIVYGHLPSPIRTGVRNVLDNLQVAGDLRQRRHAGRRRPRRRHARPLHDQQQHRHLRAVRFRHRVRLPEAPGGFRPDAGEMGRRRRPLHRAAAAGPVQRPRHLGIAVDGFALDPMAYVAPTDVRIGRAAADGVDTRYRLDPAIRDLRQNSIDRYAAFRTVYRQRRAAEIANGAAGAPNEAYEDIFNEGLDPEPTPRPDRRSVLLGGGCLLAALAIPCRTRRRERRPPLRPGCRRPHGGDAAPPRRQQRAAPGRAGRPAATPPPTSTSSAGWCSVNTGGPPPSRSAPSTPGCSRSWWSRPWPTG